MSEHLTEAEREALWKAGDHGPETCDCTGYAADSGYDPASGDVCDGFRDTVATAERILSARVREADAALDRARDLADGWERDIATLRADAVREGDMEADWHAGARQQHLDALRAALDTAPAPAREGLIAQADAALDRVRALGIEAADLACKIGAWGLDPGRQDEFWAEARRLRAALDTAPAPIDLDAVRREAKVEALREAAGEAWQNLANEVGGHTSTYSVRQWLNRRADDLAQPPTPAPESAALDTAPAPTGTRGEADDGQRK